MNPIHRLRLEYFIRELHKKYPEFGRDNIYLGMVRHPKLKGIGISPSGIKKVIWRIEGKHHDRRGGAPLHDGWKLVRNFYPQSKLIRIW